MLRLMLSLLRDNNICALATYGPEGPHNSLMAYVWNEQAQCLHLFTRKDSRKYRNMEHDPRVSLLIDTRHKQPDVHTGTMALTVSGRVHQQTDEEQAQARALLLARHPQLAQLAAHEDAIAVAISPITLQLLDGIATSFSECLQCEKKP